jgi:2'-5' RNA ligase
VSTAPRRLFFALWPGDAVRHALFHWQTQNLPPDMRWTHRDDLHLTLHFLGQVDAARLDDLRRLGGGLEQPRFTILLDEIGYWPRPRILWAAPSRVPGELTGLYRWLESGLQALGLETDSRPYRPHITLARKVRARSQWQALEPLAWAVDELALVESRPGDAPRYHPIARWPLG